ncbi:hypothetical protein DPMN_171714 [Dreissena polymorpha]|uniref:Uncharacterized protein n=1 Tax=Dreissena polymorpha TaxID=45954 RepID=A0A9D4DYH8_DREPO|nr:hypothetical protein DPMN_171714 [Dreissena polymorpha]
MDTKIKRTTSLLSTPEKGGEQKKNRMLSDSICEFNYTVESVAGNDNVDNDVLDTNTLLAQTIQESIQKSLAVEMKKMVESIISGVVDGFKKIIDTLESENKTLRNENSMLRDRVVEIKKHC